MTQAEITTGWRFFHAEVRSETDALALDGDVEIILAALGNRMISHRSAGRILQVIVDRRNQLLESEIRTQLILQQQIEAIQRVRQFAQENAPPAK
jgi:hypothetical protein